MKRLSLQHSIAIFIFAAGVWLAGQTQVQAPALQGLSNLPQPVPAATVERTGNPGRTTYYYWVVAHFNLGASRPAGPFQLDQGADSLSASAFNTISWLPAQGATSYDVLRTGSPLTPTGDCNCAVAAGVTTTSVEDQASALASYTVNTFDVNKLNAQLPASVAQAYAAGTEKCPLNADGTAQQAWLTTRDQTGTTHIVACSDPETGNIVFLANTCLQTSAGQNINCQPPPVLQPTIAISPTALNFPATNTNQPSAAQTVTATNVSTNGASVVFSGITLTGGVNYSQTNNCGTLAPGASCTISVVFTPTTTGSLGDTLTIADNAVDSSGSNPQTVSLAGSGQTPVTPTPSSATVLPAMPSLAANATQNEAVNLTMSDSTVRSSVPAYWFSSATGTATVGAGSGLVTGVGAGAATISANVGAPVQAVSQGYSSGSYSAVSCPNFPNPVRAGDRILVGVAWPAATGSISGVTDTLSNGYSAVASTLEQANGQSATWWTATGSPAGTDAITVNFAAAESAPQVVCLEVQGDTGVDVAGTTTTAAGTSLSTSLTTTQASDTIFAIAASSQYISGLGTGHYCLIQGSTGLNNIGGTACPTSPTGSAVFWRGLFAAGATTVSATMPSSNGVLSAIALKTLSASTVATVTSGATSYTWANPPANTWTPYVTSGTGGNGYKSIFYVPVTGNCYDSGVSVCPTASGILTHCYGNTSNCGNSDPQAKYVVTGNGGCTGSPEVCGWFAEAIATLKSGGKGVGIPLYYSTATDPWYSWSGNGASFKFHCYNAAVFSGSTGDQRLACLDQSQNLLVQFYAYGKGLGYSLPSSTCTSSPSCATVLTGISTASAERVGTDADYNAGQVYSASIAGNSYTLGLSTTGLANSAFTPVIRFREMAGATPNVGHAVFFTELCGYPSGPNVSTYVFPATSGLKACAAAASNEPAAGQMFVLDYTQAQINAMGLDPGEAALVKAMSKYGFYFAHTGGQNFQGFETDGDTEDQQAYAYVGVANSDEASLCSNNPTWITCSGTTGGPGNGYAYGYILGKIGRTLGPEGTDAEGNSCTVAPGCYPSGHAHAIDACVLKSEAGVGGGCL